jgi:hypothetical protein
VACTPYFLRVRPVNAAGVGAAEASVPTSEYARAVPGSPRNVRAWPVRDHASQLRVTWDAPSTDNGDAITLYMVEYSTDRFATAPACEPSCPTFTSTSGTITLTAGVTYDVRVRARNDRGYGLPGTAVAACEPDLESCDSAAIVPRGLAGPPRNYILSTYPPDNENLFTSTSLTLTWEPALTAGVPNLRYKVEWDTTEMFNSVPGPAGNLDPFNPEGGVPMSFNAVAGTSPLVEESSLDAFGKLRYIITGLHPGTLYFVRVTTANSLGFNVASGIAGPK